ncbi:MAG: hypothetical protein HGA69_00715 [Desulfobulbaceae bacterium]|nr:hypothetical protein [Desulfobulbaceae bacterium]
MKVIKLIQQYPMRWGAGLLFFAYCWLTWREFIGTVGFCPQLFCDFREYYYPMGEAILHAGLPVNGFLYSPFNALLLAAFRPLGLDFSLILWGVFQVTAIVLYFLLIHRFLRVRPLIQLLFAALTLLSFPLWLN